MRCLAQLGLKQLVLFLSPQALECWGLWECMAVPCMSFIFFEWEVCCVVMECFPSALQLTLLSPSLCAVIVLPYDLS